MDIDNFRATKVDASCNWMSIEFGENDGHNNGASIAAPKKTAYGRYLLYMIARDAVNGAGGVNWRYLGILPIGTVKYLLHMNKGLNPNKRLWRPNTSTEFRKLLTYARKTDGGAYLNDDDIFPIIEKHLERYLEVLSMEKVVK